MIVLGLLLILLAVGATAVAVTAPMATVVEMTAVGVTVKASPLAMFLAGAVSVLLLGFGFTLISRGTRRKARAHKELRELRRVQANTVAADAGESSSHPDGLRDGTGTDTAKDSSSEPQPGRHSSSEPPSSP
jgi:ABC-type nickel/cobalt efflux system permease component RcnA